MRLEFSGDLTWWQGVLLAAPLAWIAWRLYGRDVRDTGRRGLRLLLPGLRILAVLAVVTCLTGPVLTRSTEEGRVGSAVLLLDSSESMAVADEHVDAGRKILLASSCGLLPSGAIDEGLADIVRSLRRAVVLADSSSGEKRTAPGATTAKALLQQLEAVADLIGSLDPSLLSTPESKPRGLVAEYFDEIDGSTLVSLTGHESFPGAPSATEKLQELESRRDRGDRYGTRLRGWILPPVSGDYTFWISGDDESALFISPDNEAANKRLVARVDSYTSYREWERSAAQRSARIHLEYGTAYYLEVLHKEGSGEDHVSVGWKRPDGKDERPIPGLYLVPAAGGGDTPSEGPRRLRELFDSQVVQPSRVALAAQEESGEASPSLPGETATALRGWEQRFRRELTEYAKRLLAAGNTKLAEAFQSLDRLNRWERAERLLLDPDEGVVPALFATHRVEVLEISGPRPTRLWASESGPSIPAELDGAPDRPLTNLAEGLGFAVGNARERTAVVLLSDGRHNDGTSPLSVAEVLGTRGVPVFTVGFGTFVEPPDVAVVDVEAPRSVHVEDRIRGRVIVKDVFPIGSRFTLSISRDGHEVWRRNLETQGQGLRAIEFDFAAETAVDDSVKRSADGVQVISAPAALDVTVQPLPGEARQDNNSSPLRLRVITRAQKLLLLDGRARWETRFIRNLYDRDREWQIDSLIAETRDDAASWTTGEGGARFPGDRESLFTYGVIIFGEVPISAFRTHELENIRDFVEKRGGALIFVDGQRSLLSAYADSPLGALLPVEYLEDVGRPPERVELTSLGRECPALRLKKDAAENSDLWRLLPRPHFVAPVRPLEGTEVLAEAIGSNESKRPLLIHRRFGAGRVLHATFDATWRWRYEVADLYHAKYWNQIVNWLMESPFAVRDRYVSLDAGGPAYQAGDIAPLRARIRNRDGKPLFDARAEAVLYRDGVKAGTIPLEADPQGGGIYRGTTPELEPGEYEVGVVVEGFSELETKARTTFLVEPRAEKEKSDLTCDEELLRALAEATGGAYLREEESGQLHELLAPLSQGRVVVQELRLTRSYWWFLPIVFFLALEWILRKRMGMI